MCQSFNSVVDTGNLFGICMTKKEEFDKWMDNQGSLNINMSGGNGLNEDQIKILRNYPECETANDLPFDVQQNVIQLNEYDNLQNDVDAFLTEQYSLLSRNFKDFITSNR